MAEAAWVDNASGDGEPDYLALGEEFKRCRANLILHVPSWQGYVPLHQLNWQKVKYKSNEQPANSRGVYAFVLNAASASVAGRFPPVSTVLYVGETGDTSNATLRSRLKDYRKLKRQMKRPRVYGMIHRWGDQLDFHYAEVPAGISTKACETTLLDALLPPKNKKDFTALVSNARDYAFE